MFKLGYYCYSSFLYKTFWIWRARVWNSYWGLVLAIWRNTYGKRQLITKCQTWNITVPNTIQISNAKQEANNKEFKAKTYKKASLNTSLTNVTKLNFAIEIKKSVGWRHSDVLLMIQTSHFLITVSIEPNKMLVKTCSNLVARKAK